MITTRRSYENSSMSSRSGLDLLERPTETNTQATEELREKRQRNLNLILNYDKPDIVQQHEKAEQIVEAVCGKVEEKAYVDSDLNPTSTTMQFGKDGELDKETVKNELSRANSVENVRDYKVNAKGRLMLALYSLAVVVVLALIILNTGVLSTLKSSNAEKEASLASIQQAYIEQQANIESISSNEYIGNMAVEMGMSK